jgi:trehalose 6-phosphate phosphatase
VPATTSNLPFEPRTGAGRAGLAALRAEPSRALVALDYDGTLAPVVGRPQDAVPAPGAVDALRALAVRVGRLALVTGRPADVVVELGGLHDVPGLVVLGQYGVQRWQAGALTSVPAVPGLDALRAELPGVIAGEGARLEDKGLSLVVHTRGTADPVAAQRRLTGPLRVLAGAAGLELHLGRMVLELRPPGHDKRTALLSLCDPLPGAVLFAGDDVGDLPAYDAVEQLRGRGVPGVTVVSDSDEGPAALRERADVVADGPAGIVAVLQALL